MFISKYNSQVGKGNYQFSRQSTRKSPKKGFVQECCKGFSHISGIMNCVKKHAYSYFFSTVGVNNSTMKADWCVQTLQKAISKYGQPAIFNTDQSSQFTAELFVDVLLFNGIQPSMEGKGHYR